MNDRLEQFVEESIGGLHLELQEALIELGDLIKAYCEYRAVRGGGRDTCARPTGLMLNSLAQVTVLIREMAAAQANNPALGLIYCGLAELACADSKIPRADMDVLWLELLATVERGGAVDFEECSMGGDADGDAKQKGVE